MALETLRDVKKIGGFEVLGVEALHSDSPKEFIKQFIVANHVTNVISFKIQLGPIKEHGVNGCQVDTIIEAAKVILEGLDDKFPSEWNLKAIQSLNNALECLRLRKKDREWRGVEGKNEV